MSKSSAEYRIWGLMKDRCLNQNGKGYKDWGARGITICQRWVDSFEAFYADMGPRPSSDHELDRRDNWGPYSPENCRWVDRFTQANNKRNNVWLEIRGVNRTVAQWARETDGVTEQTIHKRLKRGWDAEEAVFTPSRSVRKWFRAPTSYEARF